LKMNSEIFLKQYLLKYIKRIVFLSKNFINSAKSKPLEIENTNFQKRLKSLDFIIIIKLSAFLSPSRVKFI
jgi:hypothetical protein